MSGLQTQEFPSSLRLTKAPKEQGPTVVAASETKPKKKICCACPDTKKLRDECIVEHGESACSKWIEAHRLCLRSEGFNFTGFLICDLRNDLGTLISQGKASAQNSLLVIPDAFGGRAAGLQLLPH
ncbi:hypothetical protein SSX86_006781 [Deinandra increscens subsp. villosa]|uniref:Cytochrome c oxidase copper chaperone n=1 Tax=Deinandra increscens subsp. villosa TaxID=3103831 RepID=A0AAP0DN84_9ASTR